MYICKQIWTSFLGEISEVTPVYLCIDKGRRYSSNQFLLSKMSGISSYREFFFFFFSPLVGTSAPYGPHIFSHIMLTTHIYIFTTNIQPNVVCMYRPLPLCRLRVSRYYHLCRSDFSFPTFFLYISLHFNSVFVENG